MAGWSLRRGGEEERGGRGGGAGASLAGLLAISILDDSLFTLCLLVTTPSDRRGGHEPVSAQHAPHRDTQRERESVTHGRQERQEEDRERERERERESHSRPTGKAGGGSSTTTGLSHRLLKDWIRF